tara:strand:+ start:5919 stop:6458 length:540 start_codon:yes stop_codon:yes gene_type:complete
VKHINIDGIGQVFLVKSIRAKKINISVNSYKIIKVSIPKNISFKYAKELVLTKINWIKKSLKKLSEKEIVDSIKINEIKTAKTYLKKRITLIAYQHNFVFNKVVIKNQKSRWGSCSFKNNINLNIKLYNLPNELIDYVIFHELVHTRIKNHSKEFWDTMLIYLPEAKVLDKKLKGYLIK